MPKGPQGDVIGNALGVTPAMEAGLSAQVCTLQDWAMPIETAADKPDKRGPYENQLNA